MAYNAVAQIDHEVASNSSVSASRSPSPTHGHAFEQLPLDTDNIGGGSHLETAKTSDNSSFGPLGSMIRSMTSASYDVVEDDDYDADPSPERSSSLRRIPPLNTAIAQHSQPEPPLHSACSDISVPLSHPTPDLQSLQGAYIGNVERLEQSAERLSSSSAGIDSEIRRMDLAQKRSCSSASNSINLRNGAFSPAGTISSAHGSNVSPARQRSVSVSGSRLARLSEPDDGEYAHEIDEFSPLPILPPPQPLFPQSDYNYDQHAQQQISAEMERRASVASNDTYQQARTLFTDFDGVHFMPMDRAESMRQVPLTHPPLARNPDSYKQPQAGENMVYYPAPVPRMLNLPPKLSRKTNNAHDKRRAEVAAAIVAQDRKSTAVVPGADKDISNVEQIDKRKSKVPAHLRASVFFDQPSTSLQVEVKQQSAVATLESILDASANAPVSAFTDHPFAGNLGSNVYAKSKRKSLFKDLTGQKANRLSRNTMGQPLSTNNTDEHTESATTGHGSQAGHDSDRVHNENDDSRSEVTGSESGEQSTEGEGDEEEDESEEDEFDYVGPPNTLIAELQLRKHELAHRRRTAVPMPYQGMQTTLLEMDEMAQKQSDKRRQRPVALAWEGRDEDEDVPLAMLYPERPNGDDENRPLGLMEKRQQEENEPLSSRRARLRGEPIPQPERRPITVYGSEKVSLTEQPEPAAESDDEVETETLAERLQRLKGHNRSESKFASDLMAEIDTRAGIAPKETPADPENNEEETLAQRRARLQKEPGGHPAPTKNPRVRRSMAALTDGRPTQLNRYSSYDTLNNRPGMSQYGNRMSMQQFPSPGHGMPQAYPMAQQYGYPVSQAGYPAQQTMSMNGMGYAMPQGCGPYMNMAGQPVDPAQVSVIDRWRQSIR
ncbi:uncharacterized protein N7511_005595 [Penicillium nucicola]|uniref:uncharacterized protein n=1 Tax=Penicillium nucicola TaxID=1850975 RepID=UPI002545077B|nr:uncharacterized protein N7511_005595 [Penicillium nucicola]KAJ5762213.1 hypothetical protein N7511_005595 [Penicillium nucicola]